MPVRIETILGSKGTGPIWPFHNLSAIYRPQMAMQAVTATERHFTTGFRLLTMADVDSRTNRSARQVNRVARALSSDLGNDLPVAQRMLVQRCAVLAALCTHNEAVLLNGGAINLTDYLGMTQPHWRDY